MNRKQNMHQDNRWKTVSFVLIVLLAIGGLHSLFNSQDDVISEATASPRQANTDTLLPMTAAAIAGPASTPVRSRSMTVTIACSCSNYNSVGNEWSEYYRVDNKSVVSGSTVKVSLDQKLPLFTEITEDDTIPDVGTASDTVTITQAKFDAGFSVVQEISVTENRGRYSGHTAVWTVIYAFAPR